MGSICERPGAGLSRSRLLPELAAAGALLVLVVAFNPGLTLFGRVLGGYDAFVYFYPLRSYIADTLGQGRLPLWNPFLFAGTPYLANPQTAVFYPGTWLFAMLEVPRAYAVNFLGHVWIAGLAFYAFSRLSLGLGRVAGVIGGAAFAFSGFMNGQAGHINQFSVAAWLPAVALALDLAMRTGRLLPIAALVLGLTLQIVAGHPQQTYMTVAALGVLVLWRGVSCDARMLVRGGVALGVAAALAAGISAIQLLPTLELSRLSIRGGGLSYQIASFDALPWPLLLPALFPGYWMHLPTTEFFGHLGTVLFAIAWLGLLAGAGRPAMLGALYVALGLLLAVGDATPLYRLLFDFVPGFASFRVPARWLLVSTFGLAILAAVGADWLLSWSSGGRAALHGLLRRIGVARLGLAGVVVPLGLASLVVLGQPQSRWLLLVWGLLTAAALSLALLALVLPRMRTVALTLLLVGALADLWAAGMNLEHRHPVPDVAYGQPREATTELESRAGLNPGYRSLSVATPEYVVKETGEYEERYDGASRLTLENLLVTVKWNETLWPNVPLVHRLPSIDGYDGGVLPLRAYYQLTQAMLGSNRARPDGVLASRLDAMPEARWLDLLGVRWVLASRVKDDTRGAVYYDRGVTTTIYPGQSLTLGRLPLGAFDKLGIISSLAPLPPSSHPLYRPAEPGVASNPSIGERVGTLRLIELAAGAQTTHEVPLIVGSGTAPERWGQDQAPGLERVESWSARGPDASGDWIAELSFPSQPIAVLEIVNTRPDRVLQVRALNLIDNGRQMAFPITPDSRVERLDFFDMKLYDRQDALPRARLVEIAQVLDDAEAATLLADSAFDPRIEVVLAPSASAGRLSGTPRVTRAEITEDRAENVRIAVRAQADSYLVLADSWYPGWIATVDGVEVPIERANILFRAVRVPVGDHTVEFRYEPGSIRTGAMISVGSIVASVMLFTGAAIWRRRRRRGAGA
ncbi:MAG TPA: YfhO family protein [Chloroflexota bacterium]|nr:YfhO family protein [Chloroflexota bacterium]